MVKMPPPLLDFDLNCFSQSYLTARKQFLSVTEKLSAANLSEVQTFTHSMLGPTKETLACDVAYIGNRTNPDRLFVLISATHGVEGFAGSAIQLNNMPLFSAMVRADNKLGVIVIHALNPWGFAWLRRYDHESIDLNRNFIDFSQPLPKNKQYDKLHSMLSNNRWLMQGNICTLWHDIGLQAYAEIVNRGQHHYSNGCCYGGRAASWSRQILETITQQPMIKNAKKMAIIDLHTGLGPYGYGEVINDHQPATAGYNLTESFYGANARSVLLGESCSSPKDGLMDYHWHDIMQDRGSFVTLEFGTYSMKQLLSALIKEQLYHSSLSKLAEDRNLDNKHVQALKDFFYPAEKTWQQQVLFRGRQIIELALNGLHNA